MNNNPNIAILYHIFYEDTYEKIFLELAPLKKLNAIFLFNICDETPNKILIAEALRKNFNGCFIITSSNKGKDIGAKLALIQLLLLLNINIEFILFLHDKKSLQALKSATWKKDLLKIISPENISFIIKKFEKNEHYGIIGTREYIIFEELKNNKLTSINGFIISNLLSMYNLNPVSYQFVAGTMFWAKAKPLIDFFRQYNPLEIRKSLEDGNVIDNFSGTNTHSWERLLSWIVISSGYKITGI